MTKPVSHRIQSIFVVEPFRLRAVFIDGTEKEYDLRRWEHRPEFSLLFRHPTLQTAVRVEPGGYGISWNDKIDLAAEEIYWNGIDIVTNTQKEPGTERSPRMGDNKICISCSQCPPWSGKTVFVVLAVMFVIHIGLCWWISHDERSWVREPQYQTVRNVKHLAKRLGEYHQKNGCFPGRLEAMFADRNNLDNVRKYELSDGWNHPLNYVTDGKTWRITSGGSDGQPGGVGVETDICFTDAMFVTERFQGVSLRESYKAALPTLKQIFVKEFFVTVFFSCCFFLPVYFGMPTFIYWWCVLRKQATNAQEVKLGCFVWWLFALMLLNYFTAMIVMIPAARK